MPVIKITGQGLCSIALLTGILWGCIVMEKSTVDHARLNAQRALEEIRVLQLKRQAVPASAPRPVNQPARSTAS